MECYYTHKVEEVFSDMSQHARVGGPQHVLHSVWPILVLGIILQVIDILKVHKHILTHN